MEFSSGCVVFKTREKPYKVLIILQKNGHHFGFPKGHVEPFETYEQTAIRETKEEVGLDVSLSKHYIEVSYEPRMHVFKTVRYYLAFTHSDTVKIQDSEILSASFVDIKEAFATLTYNNDKDVLKQCVDILSEESL